MLYVGLRWFQNGCPQLRRALLRKRFFCRPPAWWTRYVIEINSLFIVHSYIPPYYQLQSSIFESDRSVTCTIYYNCRPQCTYTTLGFFSNICPSSPHRKFLTSSWACLFKKMRHTYNDTAQNTYSHVVLRLAQPFFFHLLTGRWAQTNTAVITFLPHWDIEVIIQTVLIP